MLDFSQDKDFYSGILQRQAHCPTSSTGEMPKETIFPGLIELIAIPAAGVKD